MTTVDMRGWTKKDVFPLSSGEIAVRPGLRRVLAPDASRVFVGGFSVLNPFTGEVWSYVFDCTSSVSVNRDLRLRVYDENWTIQQTLGLGLNVDPRVITHAVVEGQIIICSPDFPTLWGLVGSMIILAVKVASDNDSTTAIDVPVGICCSFGNRAVIADGPSLYFSDPVGSTGGDLRTYVGQNQNQRPAPVFGLHEGAGGALVVLTQRGVYGLDASAGAVGIVGSNGTAWNILSHAESWTFASSAAVNGRVYALCRKGYKLVDTENSDEETLSDPMIPRTYGPRIASDDWREALMFSGDDGPVVSYGGNVSMHDLSEQVRSWWTRAASDGLFRVRGVLKTPDGTDLLMSEDGIYEPVGNYDAGTEATPAATQPKGVLLGRVLTPVGENPRARDLRFAASCGGEGNAYVSVRGDAQTLTIPADNRALIIGTSSWGATGVIYEAAPLAAGRWQGALDTHDMGVECAADFAETRLSVALDFGTSESAKKRPGEAGN